MTMPFWVSSFHGARGSKLTEPTNAVGDLRRRSWRAKIPDEPANWREGAADLDAGGPALDEGAAALDEGITESAEINRRNCLRS